MEGKYLIIQINKFKRQPEKYIKIPVIKCDYAYFDEEIKKCPCLNKSWKLQIDTLNFSDIEGDLNGRYGTMRNDIYSDRISVLNIDFGTVSGCIISQKSDTK